MFISLLLLGCSEDNEVFRESCLLEVSAQSSTADNTDVISVEDTSNAEAISDHIIWYAGESVQLSVQPLSSNFDTLVLLNGQKLTSDTTWEYNRLNCNECDTCKEDNGCSMCSDCDICSDECTQCEEEISFELPVLQEDVYQLQVKNTFGESEPLQVYIMNNPDED